MATKGEQFITIRNFELFQHYKDRKPPWIKLYFDLLSDRHFYRLPDASKFHVVGLFLIASQCGNKIPLDIPWISRQLACTEELRIEELVDSGFVQLVDASNMLASRKQDAIADKETETEEKLETEGETETCPPAGDVLASAVSVKLPEPTARLLFDTYNRERGGMPEAREFTEDRRRKCDARLRIHHSDKPKFIEAFTESIQRARNIPFMLGAGSQGWKAGFDWFIANDTNYLKVLEGKYDRQSKQPTDDPNTRAARDFVGRKLAETLQPDLSDVREDPRRLTGAHGSVS